MKIWTKRLLLSVAFAASTTSVIVAEAGCHGRSGGYSSGHSYGGSSHSRVSHYPSYPVHSSAWSTPTYSHPQTVYVQPQQHVTYSQPVSQPQYLDTYQGQALPSSVTPFNGVPVSSSAPFQTQPVSQQQFLTQQAPQQTQQPLQNFQQPVSQQQVPQQAQQPLQNLQQPAPQPLVASGDSVEQSALQALGAFAPPMTAETQPQQTSSIPAPVVQPIVGKWTARLANGSTVQLILQPDGAFNWTATNTSGNTTSFQGQYSVENGMLVLSRSGDNQRLSGAASMTGNDAFSFKLANNNAAGLEFHRS